MRDGYVRYEGNGGIRLTFNAHATSPEQIEAARAKMRDDLERAALTLELIDARRRLLGDKVDRDWERSVVDAAIRDLDPAPPNPYRAILGRIVGGAL